MKALAFLLALAAPAAAETVRIGTESYYPRYVFFDDKGTRVGSDVDVMAEVCARAAWDCVWIETPFPGIFEGLAEDRYDLVVGGTGEGPGREAYALFSTVYYQPRGSDSYVLSTDADADPATLTIAVAEGTLLEDALRAGGHDVLPVVSNEAAIAALFAGEVGGAFVNPAYFLDLPFAQRDVLTVLEEITVDKNGPQISVAIDRPDLLATADRILAAMKADGTLAAINEAWYPRDEDAAK